MTVVIPSLNTNNNNSNANISTNASAPGNQNKNVNSQDTNISPSTVNQQIVWIPKIEPQQDGHASQQQTSQPPPLFNIKQLNYSQVTINITFYIFST